MPVNFEFKARCNDLPAAEAALMQLHPRFAGEDQQTDTYFNVHHGRLKLREGTIENALIHYNRTNAAQAKQSDVLLYQHRPDASLKNVLTAALGIKAVVNKTRKIFFVDNVKVHFDQVEHLGTFLEVEAIDLDNSMGLETLKEQCRQFAALLGVHQQDMLPESYSDMLLEKNPH